MIIESENETSVDIYCKNCDLWSEVSMTEYSKLELTSNADKEGNGASDFHDCNCKGCDNPEFNRMRI